MTRARAALAPLAIPLDRAEATDAGRFGPKAATLAALARAGLPTPGGTCIDAEAYRAQLAHLGLELAAHRATTAEPARARRYALEVRLGLFEQPIAPEVEGPLLSAWRALDAPGVVRSSALVEDRPTSSFAGQFQSYLGLESEADFLTAVRACWAALWSVRALRYMARHDVDPAAAAMAVLVQPLVAARVSGGGLSRTAAGEMVLSATPGLGSAIAQGEVVPDQYLLGRDGSLRMAEAGRAGRRLGCDHAHRARALSSEEPLPMCLDRAQAAELGRMLLAAEDVIGAPVEIEWALDGTGVKLLQARPLCTETGDSARPSTAPCEPCVYAARTPYAPRPEYAPPAATGQPAGSGWGTGRACVVSCECELGRLAPGDVLVTRAAGPALVDVLPRVAAVVAELGGSTSHLAALARERRIPMVLGVRDATQRIPDGVEVAVDGVAGCVRWAR